MPSILLRIFLLYNLLNTILLYLIPKKLRSYLPPSWYPLTVAADSIIKKSSSPLPPPPSSLSSSLPASTISVRRMDANELKRVFQMFDQNGDGRITKKELTDSLSNMGIFIPVEELNTMIDKIDANKDGCIDIDEFGELYQSIMDGRDEDQDMMEAFNVFDQNGDGFITADELKLVLGSLGLKQGRTAEDCKSMINKVDVNGDGRVDFNEFKQMMRGGGFAALT